MLSRGDLQENLYDTFSKVKPGEGGRSIQYDFVEMFSRGRDDTRIALVHGYGTVDY